MADTRPIRVSRLRLKNARSQPTDAQSSLYSYMRLWPVQPHKPTQTLRNDGKNTVELMTLQLQNLDLDDMRDDDVQNKVLMDQPWASEFDLPRLETEIC